MLGKVTENSLLWSIAFSWSIAVLSIEHFNLISLCWYLIFKFSAFAFFSQSKSSFIASRICCRWVKLLNSNGCEIKNKYWPALILGDVDYGFICISHILTLNIIKIGFQNSFYCFRSFSACKYVKFYHFDKARRIALRF